MTEKIHSLNYINRLIEPIVERYLKIFPVVGLTGPRRAGKSTMLKTLLENRGYKYITFDDFSLVQLFKGDPEKFLKIYDNFTIFDEVQKESQLFDYIKVAIDREPGKKGRFVLTGSSQFTLNKESKESLAGRIGLLSLLPFAYKEIPEPLREHAIFRGGYPECINSIYQYNKEWFSSYMETYVLKDASNLFNIGDLTDFRRLITLLAGNIGHILDLTFYSKQLGVSVSTIKRWVSILEASYIIFLVQPYYNNFGKRIIKRPKIYFHDTGLACFLTGVHSLELFENGPMCGQIFENYIASELIKKRINSDSQMELYFYRTSTGTEINFILIHEQKTFFIEIKSSYTFKNSMIHPIEKIKSPEDHGFLVYRGENKPFTNNISIINYKEFLENFIYTF